MEPGHEIDESSAPLQDVQVIRIAAGTDGRDELVRSYAEEHRTTCAVHIISWKYIFWSFFLLIVGGALGSNVVGETAPPPYDILSGTWLWYMHYAIGNPLGFVIGVAIGALALSLMASIGHARLRTLRPRWAKRLLGYHGQNMGQEPIYAACALIPIYFVVYDPLIAASLITSVLAACYIGAMMFRLAALLFGSKAKAVNEANMLRSTWPMYTVLVPLYREEAVADKILKNLTAMDYPKDSLDVKFLLEADDPGTLAVLEREGIPSWCEIIVVPDAQPKTKPRACNHGLERARGDFLVIFDAEDKPEPDQLKKAVLAFEEFEQACKKPVVCLQAQLAYHNASQNMLTKWFAIEYNVWFQRYLNGLHRLGGPLPLGGTSNHFRVPVLRELGGWDPFNVTEDCDLGIRLHLKGYRTATLESTTWEEANSRVGNWLRQRSRWLKGYMVTHIVWARSPVRLFCALGPFGFCRFLASIIGIAGLAVLNLPLWILLAVYIIFLGVDMSAGWQFTELLATPSLPGDGRLSWPLLYIGIDDGSWWHGVSNKLAQLFGIEGPFDIQDTFWSALSVIFALVSFMLFVANGLFIAINACFGSRPGQRGLLIAALLTPFYWVLISLAAWKGLWQLCFNPHKWEKTVHGLDHEN